MNYKSENLPALILLETMFHKYQKSMKMEILTVSDEFLS